jgi:hypothetical protein
MAHVDPRILAFISRCDALANRLRISRTTLSTRILFDGKRLDSIASGASDIGVGRLARAENDLSKYESAQPTSQALAREAGRIALGEGVCRARGRRVHRRHDGRSPAGRVADRSSDSRA